MVVEDDSGLWKGDRRKNISKERRPFLFFLSRVVRYNYPIKEILAIRHRIATVRKKKTVIVPARLRKEFLVQIIIFFFTLLELPGFDVRQVARDAFAWRYRARRAIKKRGLMNFT